MSFYDRVINANSAPGPGPVVEWRAERLIEAGVPSEMARRVAADRAYDLHAVLVLVDRGCPAELALRILAPLDQDDVHC
jgi:hypothetical protein